MPDQDAQGGGVSNAIKDAAGSIPDVYYDLIGRLPAGLVLVSSVTWVIASTASASSPTELLRMTNHVSTGIVSIILIGGGITTYAIGLLLSGPGRLLAMLHQAGDFRVAFDALSSDRQAVLKAFFERTLEELRQFRIFDSEERRLHFTLKSKSPHAQSRILAKMRAEVALTYNLQAAALLAVVFTAVYTGLVATASRPRMPEFLILGSIFGLSFVASFARARNYYSVEFGMMERAYLSASERLRLPPESPKDVPNIAGGYWKRQKEYFKWCWFFGAMIIFVGIVLFR